MGNIIYVRKPLNEFNNYDENYVFKSIKSGGIYPNEVIANQIIEKNNTINKFYDFEHYSLLFISCAYDLYKISVKYEERHILHLSSYIGCINYICLSIELYLKALSFLLNKGKETEIKLEHNIINLYNRFPQKYKEDSIVKFLEEVVIIYGENGDKTRYPISKSKSDDNNYYKYYDECSYNIDISILLKNTEQLFYRLKSIYIKEEHSNCEIKFEGE